MKKILLPLVLMMAAFSASAQNPAEDPNVNERFFEAKVSEFVYRLKLTKEQEEKFVPVYKKYSEEMRAAVGLPAKPEGRPGKKAKKDNGKIGQPDFEYRTTEEVAAMIKERIQRQQKAQNVRLAYVDEFARILNPKQLNRLFDVEKKIQDKLMNRKDRHDGGPGRGRGNKKDRFDD